MYAGYLSILRTNDFRCVFRYYYGVNANTAIVSLGLTYQVKIMTLASTVFKRSTFKINSHLNALGSKFDLDVK